MFVVALLAQSDSVTSNNYSELKDFIQGFMDGYNDSKFNLPADCLSSDIQTELDEAVIAMIQAILQRDVEKIYEQWDTLMDHLTEIIEDCGLDEVSKNFREDVVSKGVFWVFKNFFIHAHDVEEKFSEMARDIAEGKWYRAGDDLGILMRYIVPVSSQTYSFTPDNIAGLLEGFLKGICKDPSNPGECYPVLNGLVISLDLVSKDLWDLIRGKANYVKMYEDAFKLYNDVKTADLSVCGFKDLVNDISQLSLTKLMDNYMENSEAIRSSLVGLKSCLPNFVECGTDAGELFKMIIGWSIN